jgi:hypothetical protein
MPKKAKSSATEVTVVITGTQANRGLKETAWANNAKIKVNGVATDVTLWTSSMSEPEYTLGERVRCSLIRKANGEHYFGTSYVPDADLDNVTL